MRLARLAALERKKIEDEYLEVIQQIAELEDILANPPRVLAIIKDELRELKKQVRRRAPDAGRGRRQSRELTDEDLIADEDVVVTISGRGYIKRQPVATYRRQHRGGKGIIGHVTREEDAVEHLLVANTHDWALFFTNRGRVFSAKVHAIPDASRQAKGLPIINMPGRPGRGRRGPDGDDHAARVRRGLVPRPRDPARASSRRRRSSSSSASARPGSGRSRSTRSDELAWVDVSSGEDDVIIATAQGMIARFHETEVRRDGPRRGRRHRHPAPARRRATRSSR